MPKVSHAKKSSRGAAYSCARCSQPIIAGQGYYSWAFFRGPTVRQHDSHGRPKESQLTNSKMSAAYAAVEELSENISSASSFEDLKDALEGAASSLSEVADEYEDSLSNLPQGLQDSETGQAMQDKADKLREAEQVLTDAAGEMESEWDELEDEPELGSDGRAEWDEKADTLLEKLRSDASDAAGEVDLEV